MGKPYADASAHNSIPDDFIGCILTRRHSFPLTPASEAKVRIKYGDSPADTLDVFEAVDACGFCGATRTLWREQINNRFVVATYIYPDGYIAPTGTRWDRGLLWEIYRERNPVKGRARVVDKRT